MFRRNIIDKIDGESSCKGKVKYGHEETAKTAALKMAKKKREPFEAYKCRHCEAWHVGHPKFFGWLKDGVAAVSVDAVDGITSEDLEDIVVEIFRSRRAERSAKFTEAEKRIEGKIHVGIRKTKD